MLHCRLCTSSRLVNPCLCSVLTYCHSKEDADSIFVDGDNRIQILETMGWLQHADKEQGAAFIVRDLPVFRPQHPY